MAIALDQFSKLWSLLSISLWLTLLFSSAKLHSESRAAVSCVAASLATDTLYEIFHAFLKFCLSFNCRWLLEFGTSLPSGKKSESIVVSKKVLLILR